MARSLLPFYCFPSPAVERMLRSDIDRIAHLALQAILKHRKSLEVAHQQICYRGQSLAFSSRISAGGHIIIQIDIGDPRLDGLLILEEEHQSAMRKVKDSGRAGARRGSRN